MSPSAAKSKLTDLLKSHSRKSHGILNRGLISADEATILAIIAEKRRMSKDHFLQLTHALQRPVTKKVAKLLWLGGDDARKRNRAAKDVRAAARQIEDWVDQNRKRIRHSDVSR